VTALTFARVWLGCGLLNTAVGLVNEAVLRDRPRSQEAIETRKHLGLSLFWTASIALTLVLGPPGLALRGLAAFHHVTKNRDPR
jgi:hypothetical protein